MSDNTDRTAARGATKPEVKEQGRALVPANAQEQSPSSGNAVIKSDADIVADLALVALREIEKFRIAQSNALDHAMNAGDAFNALQPKVVALGFKWKAWVREKCLVAESTAALYQQLARHRDEIEAAILQGMESTLRAARRLISNPRDQDDADDGQAEQHDDAGRDHRGNQHDSGADPKADSPETLAAGNSQVELERARAMNDASGVETSASDVLGKSTSTSDTTSKKTASEPEANNAARNAKSVLSVKTWRTADEAVKTEITQSEDIAIILGRMSEAQKEKLFDRLIALQIKQAKPLASKSIDEMLKSISGTFWHMAGQNDPQKIAEAMTIINAKLAKRQLSAKDIKFAAVKRERKISEAAIKAAEAARQNLKRSKAR